MSHRHVHHVMPITCTQSLSWPELDEKNRKTQPPRIHPSSLHSNHHHNGRVCISSISSCVLFTPTTLLLLPVLRLLLTVVVFSLNSSEQRELASRMEKKQLKEFMGVRLPYCLFDNIQNNTQTMGSVTTLWPHRSTHQPKLKTSRCTPVSSSAASMTASPTSPPSPSPPVKKAAPSAVSTSTSRVRLA